MALAGAGTVATFQFLAHRPVAKAGAGGPEPIIGPNLAGLGAAPLPRAPLPRARATLRTLPSFDVTNSGVEAYVPPRSPTIARLTPQDITDLELAPSSLTSVQLSWSLVKGRMDAVGKSALVRLFIKQPDRLQLFGFHEDSNYVAGRAFKMHAAAIMRTVGKVIDNMGNLVEVVPMLARLGRSHALLGIRYEPACRGTD